MSYEVTIINRKTGVTEFEGWVDDPVERIFIEAFIEYLRLTIVEPAKRKEVPAR